MRTTSISRRGAALLLTYVMAATLVAVPDARPAEAATMFGHDVSWPQCPTSQGGYGLPMPPSTTQFVIIGLTKGLPFTRNPCLVSQVSWATSRNKPAHGYTIPAFPTDAQLSKYGASGPWSTTTRAGRLSNVGYAEARFTLDTAKAAGFAPPVVWIDVEPRAAQPWPSGTASRQRANRYVIEGMMRGLRDAKVPYGLYSYTNGWAEITGSWRLPGVPVWATAGRLDYPTEALDRCTQPSFSGGRVYISQWYDDTRDYDRTCDPYAFTPLKMPPSSLSNTTNEVDGDWRNDLVARKTSTGELWLYPGDGRGGLLPPTLLATGWQKRDLIDVVGDLDGDGTTDLVARTPSTGELWLHPGNGRGKLGTARRIGSGWNKIDAIAGVDDLNGDQRPDLVARTPSTGELWFYPGNGRGGFGTRVRIGGGWNTMNGIVGPGDLNGDGRADLLGRKRDTGELFFYPGNGRGAFGARVRIGSGWNKMNALVGPGDVTGDRRPDLVAREASTGHLWLYPGDGAGAFLPRTRIGTGWNTMNPIR